MKGFLKFLGIVLILNSAQIYAQSTPLKAARSAEIASENRFERLHNPKEYLLYNVAISNLLTIAKQAPELSSKPSGITLTLPDASGDQHTFWIYNNPNMERELAQMTPNIQSLKAVDIKDRSHTLSLSISDIFGLHGMGMKGDGEIYYIDNYTNDLKTVMIYNRSSLELPKNGFSCLVPGDSFDNAAKDLPVDVKSLDNKRRTFRLALACTIEYAAYHISKAPAGTPNTTTDQKKDIVLAAMNVTLTRLNQIFERELNVHLNLVASNKNIIFITSDSFDNNNANNLINQSQTVITNTIGSSNFDIGHTFSTGGGGLASLGAVCNSQAKASGITGSSAPVGDAYDVDYVAHEMGHQFGANHTFNNSCSGNRNNTTAMETGSGSTIMSYAGICPQNVQSNVDDYYHYISIREIQSFLQGASCAQQTTITNSAPIVSDMQTKTIPYGTPFILATTATDSDGDKLTYAFEQINTQISAQPPLATSIVGPAFRSVRPTTKNYRSFPSENTVLGGTTFNHGIVSSTWECLATTARSYSFVATVRDNNPLGGRVVYTQPVTILVAGTGPFVITSPNNDPTASAPVWKKGTQQTITWNVGGTTANGIDVSLVNILVSTDAGATYSMLAANVPNNGSATVTIPGSLPDTYEGRIKIEAVNNIFYTVSKRIIIWNATAGTDETTIQTLKIYPNPAHDILNISFGNNIPESARFDIFDLNGRLIKTMEYKDSELPVQQINIGNLAVGTYILKVDNGKDSTSHKFIKN